MMQRALALLSVAGSLCAQVSFDRILGANQEPQNWLTYSGTDMSQRYSLLNQITPENVKTVERGEEELKALGFRQFRVRFHGDIVRLEIAPEEMPKALNMETARRFTEIFRALGFQYVTLDLEGYRQGSLNEVLRMKK